MNKRQKKKRDKYMLEVFPFSYSLKRFYDHWNKERNAQIEKIEQKEVNKYKKEDKRG